MNTQTRSHAAWIGLIIFVVALIVNIDFTAVNVALVAMSQDLHAPLTLVQWVLSGYMATWAATMVLGGRLTDCYGAKRIFLLGVVLFTVSSVVAGLSVNVSQLIAMRIVQGLGGALFIPAAYALIFINVEPEKQGQIMGILGGAIGLGLAIGPTVGGIILHLLNWRWIFFINIPLGIIVLWLTAKYTKHDVIGQKQRVGWPAAIALLILVAALILGVGKINDFSMASSADWTDLIVLLVLLIVYAIWQYRSKQPLLKLRLLKNKVFSSTLWIYTAFQACFVGLLFILALYVESILQLSDLNTGYLFLAITLVFGVLSVLAGRLSKYIPATKQLAIGMAIIVVGCALLVSLGVNGGVAKTACYFVVLGIGLGIVFPAANTRFMQALSQDEVGVGSGLFSMSAALVQAISISVAALLFSHWSLNFLSRMSSYVPTPKLVLMKHSLQYGHLSQSLLAHLGVASSLLLQHAFAYGYRHVVVVYLVLALLGLLASIKALFTRKSAS